MILDLTYILGPSGRVRGPQGMMSTDAQGQFLWQKAHCRLQRSALPAKGIPIENNACKTARHAPAFDEKSWTTAYMKRGTVQCPTLSCNLCMSHALCDQICHKTSQPLNHLIVSPSNDTVYTCSGIDVSISVASDAGDHDLMLYHHSLMTCNHDHGWAHLQQLHRPAPGAGNSPQ